MATEEERADIHREKLRAVRVIANVLFGRNNLIVTDFADIRSHRVDWETWQDNHGIRFQFIVANNAMGKVMNQEVSDAPSVLLDDDEEQD